MTQQEAPGIPHRALRSDDVGDESPQGETEVMVGRVFAEMLDAPALPRTASLFDLGLDSMSVTIACARLEQITGMRVRFTQIFRTPTVAELAAWIDAHRDGAGDEPSAPATAPDARGDELVAITPVQAETVPQKIVVDFAWWFDGAIDEDALESAATDIHRRHQALHARYLDGSYLGLAEVPAEPGRPLFHRLGEADSDETAVEALRRALRLPLKLDEGEVWRCALVRSARSGRTLFGLAVDHAGFDGHSWGLLTTELSAAYAARAAGKAPQWPLRTASLAEMSADFRQQLASADIEAQRRYWREELHELPPCRLPERAGGAQIPPMPENSRYSLPGPATTCDFLVPQSRLQPWDDYARAHGMPSSVGMAAVYVESLIRAGAAPDFAVVVAIANNSGDVIDGTITNRVGNIVLRPNGPSHPDPHILARTREAYLQAMAARDVLIVPEELGDALSGPGEKLIRLERLVALNYNTTPELSLGGVAGTLLSEGATLASQCHYPVMLIVSPLPDGLDLSLQVRTDMYDAGLADQIKRHFLDIIADGPERLEQRTA